MNLSVGLKVGTSEATGGDKKKINTLQIFPSETTTAAFKTFQVSEGFNSGSFSETICTA